MKQTFRYLLNLNNFSKISNYYIAAFSEIKTFFSKFVRERIIVIHCNRFARNKRYKYLNYDRAIDSPTSIVNADIITATLPRRSGLQENAETLLQLHE